MKTKKSAEERRIAKLRKELRKLGLQKSPLAKLLTFVAKRAKRKSTQLRFSPKLSRTELRAKLKLIQHNQLHNRPTKCVHCGHEHLHSKGLYRDGRRRWLCTKCHRSFNDFTRSTLGYIHKINELIQYLETDFFNGTAVRKAAERLKVDKRTIFAWRHRISTALQSLLGKLPDEYISVINFSQEISLKGSGHTPGHEYKNPKVKIESLNGETFINGFVLTDDGGHRSIQLVSFGEKMAESVGEQFLKRCVKARKRVVVPEKSTLAEIGRGLKRGKRRIECGGNAGGALCQHWKNLANPRAFFLVAQFWGIKFHGVATKYQNNYFATISWIASHFHEPNWFNNLLSELLSNRIAVRKYQELRYLKLE